MATKQELEAQVVELQKQLSDQTPPDIASLQEEIKSLDEQLSLCHKTIDEQSAEKNVLENQLGSLQAQLRVIGEQKKTAPSQDGVVLAGNKYDIIMQERVGDFIHLWRKNFVHDDELILVVRKS